MMGGRKRTRQEPTCRDHLSENITLKKGLCGAKPLRFNQWILGLLNWQRGDELDDLFPGTNGMQTALSIGFQDIGGPRAKPVREVANADYEFWRCLSENIAYVKLMSFVAAWKIGISTVRIRFPLAAGAAEATAKKKKQKLLKKWCALKCSLVIPPRIWLLLKSR